MYEATAQLEKGRYPIGVIWGAGAVSGGVPAPATRRWGGFPRTPCSTWKANARISPGWGTVRVPPIRYRAPGRPKNVRKRLLQETSDGKARFHTLLARSEESFVFFNATKYREPVLRAVQAW